MLRRLYYSLAYWASLFIFGAVSLGLNAVCAPLLLLPRRERFAPSVRETIRRLFASWTKLLSFLRLVRVTWIGADAAALPRPAVYVANHPSLVDATLLLARLPDAVCIFKPALLRSPFLAPAAIMAGYAAGDAGIDLIRDLALKVSKGSTVLIFPEGTRTSRGSRIDPLKAGFAAIARHANVPVQILIIRANRELMARGWSLWSVPNLPVRFDIHVDRLLPADPEISSSQRAAEVGKIFAERLGGPP